MNLMDALETMKNEHAIKAAAYADSAIYAYMIGQIEALKERGENPAEYELIFVSSAHPYTTEDGMRIDRTVRLRKIGSDSV